MGSLPLTRVRWLLIVATLALAAPGEALGHGVLRREGDVLRYFAPDPGIGARLAITSPLRGRVVFSDEISPGGMDWGPCFPLSEKRSRCPVRGVDRVRIELFDGPDVLRTRVSLATEVDAGDGADRVSGGYAPDTVLGGPDADVLDGGAGRDRLAGGPGGDTIRARDGARDEITCGDGMDSVIADPGDEISALELPACEEVLRAPAPADRKAPALRVRARPRQGFKASGPKLRVSMGEPGSFRARGRIRIAGGAATALRATGGRPDAPGQAWTVSPAVPRPAAARIRAALADGRRVLATISVRARDRGDNIATRKTRVRLQA